ncbi:MAG: hypothetical protein KBC33_00200 [Candidatus Pacebacteria bacterium]|nr:hypothetical protein [Candidatus Paceibacterota bacterium]
MTVKLFIIAHSPFIMDTAHHRLCLVVRRKGPISESGLAVPIGETEVPIIARSPDIFDNRRNPITDVLIPETRRCLGGPVSTFIAKQSMKHGRLVLFKNDKDPRDGTIWYGVRVDEIFDQALLPASYGCLDAFDCDDLARQMKEVKKSQRTIPLRKLRRSKNPAIRKMAKHSPNLMVMSATVHHDHLQHDDLYMGEKVLAHFQKLEDERIARLPRIYYRAGGMVATC